MPFVCIFILQQYRYPMLAPNTTVIPKELIAGLRFPKQPVAISDEQRKAIVARLDHARRLGNGERGKCRIIFHDDIGAKAVETTIWTFDADNIVLKYGMTIPLVRVVDIHIL
jgi:hypothetical protein